MFGLLFLLYKRSDGLISKYFFNYQIFLYRYNSNVVSGPKIKITPFSFHIHVNRHQNFFHDILRCMYKFLYKITVYVVIHDVLNLVTHMY